MENILIIGPKSYIGEYLGNILKNYYQISFLSLRSSEWETYDFSKFKTIIYTAGIVHKPKEMSSLLYYKINSLIPYYIALKAKKSGVERFIYFSSMSVFGIINGVIDQNSSLNPTGFYGKSKKTGEILLNKLSNPNFKICIIRPPMVYGFGCKGNYSVLSRFIKKYRIFTKTENKRGIIYIENLSEFIKIIIEKDLFGKFHPQNSYTPSTLEICQKISEVNKLNLHIIPSIHKLIGRFNNIKIKKIYGDLYYHETLTKIGFNYNVINFESSIQDSERSRMGAPNEK